ncbi:copalyl diphosphate synthase 1 [Cryptomeria japonica]|uniref:copalyl diphosphate synthase 1 n=1 Tax=Cryptomeria japonica TaxID=3369 RepID=UPI0027DA2643|nr:copalyl diphosphate synthase 1 [Cryptomeria japonica]
MPMAALSFSVMSTYAIPRLPSSYPPPLTISQRRSRDAKHHLLMSSPGASNFKFINERNGFNGRTYQKVKRTSGYLLENASNVAQENIVENSFASMCIDDDIATIRLLFSDIKRRHTSLSAYDTAWVAMVPSLDNSKLPQFPQCLSWIMENQLWDGSWGLLDLPYIKDRLSHTLACLIALRTWNVGSENVEMGLRFIKKNIAKIASEDKYNPLGFDLIFTAMLEDARGLCLELPYDSLPIKMMFTKREKILKSIGINHMNEYDPSLIFIVEGIRKIVDWNKVLRHENKDGSLFHSPSATACALMYTRKSSCLKYLNSMLEDLKNGVPSVYPINLVPGLSMVDSLESLGIGRHFKHEIKQVLDDVYRLWTENEIIQGISSASDIINLSTSFRILRWNGYDVSPDVFLRCLRDSDFLLSLENSGQATTAFLNLYRASQLMFPGETILEEAKSFSQNYLEKIMMDEQNIALKDLEKEVKHALDVPWIASVERIEHRKYMKTFPFDHVWIGKTSYRIPFIGKDFLLTLATKDYNICQAAQQKDLQELEKWSADLKLGDLHFARQKLIACYLSAASTLFSLEMSTPRIVWTKNAILITVMDDFFDVEGSTEEIQCFVEAIRRWDPRGVCNSSDNVKTLFSAIYNTVNDIAQDAWGFQDRDISTHLREIWYRLAISMMKEAGWIKTGYIPSMQEYIKNGEITIALEPILFTSLYFVCPKLSEKTIHHPEYNNLMQLVNTCGRLLNDIQSYEREIKQGKLNSLSLFMKEYPTTSIKDATKWIRLSVSESTQQLLKNLLQPSVLPRDCKQLYWNLVRIIQMFCLNTDEFTSPIVMLEHIKAVLFDPVI